MTSKKYIAKNIFMALLPIFLYNGINFVCIVFFAAQSIASSEEMLDLESILNYHYFQFDSLFCIVILILFSIWFSRIQKHNPQSPTLKESHLMVKIPILALGIGGLSSLCFVPTYYLQSIPLISNSLESFEDTWSTIDAEPYFWVLLSVVLVGPIVEELLFRGIMFHYLENVKKGWFPILFSGITFGLWHGEPVQVIYTVLMGILIGIIYARVRDLKVTITLHILNNFLSTLPPALNTDFVQNIIFYVSLLMVLPTIYILVRMVRKMPKPEIN